ncbi:MAG TPA: transketolase C-terminal domain-containing protein [Anaerolineales bacterium]|nr:transketolase C-terminal domain-containing protein [Anaerolineales bacterium]
MTDSAEIDWERVARVVISSRIIDTIAEEELAPAGKIPYQFSAKGHELAQALLGLSLTHPHDAAGVYYRSRTFMLAAGLTPEESFSADMARTGSPSEGRDVGVVYSMPPRGGLTVLPASGDVGAQFTPVAGWAQAITYYLDELGDSSWEGALAVALGGDGSVASNGFWSALTIATTLELPMLFFIEDNGYGISVPRHFQTPGGDIAANLESFAHLRVLSGSGTDPEGTADLVRQAVSHVRSGAGPCLLRLQVPRLTGHTYGEDQTAYKSAVQIEEERALDPLHLLRDFLGNRLDWPAMEKEIEAEIRAELEAAYRNPEPERSSWASHLFFDGVEALVPPPSSGLQADKGPGVLPDPPESTDRAIPLIPLQSPDPSPATSGPRLNYLDSIRRVLEVELEVNSRLLVFGEDVGLRGGVHRATLDLQSRFGNRRVFDTSLSEEGIIGRSVGLSLAGLTPAPEIQFRKYADPATEQINDAGWIRWRTAGKFGAHMVVRIPVGYSRRTGDPWHSVTGEAVYSHTLGWRIAFPSNASDAAGLLRYALRSSDPVLFLEHRALLDAPQARRAYPGDEFILPFGQAVVVLPGKWLTIVTWGEMVYRCLEAAEGLDGQVEILDLRTIQPWDQEAVLASVRKTGRCLIVHEDTVTGGFGAEVAATVGQEAFDQLDAPVTRLATPDSPIPYSIPLMHSLIPSVEQIRGEIEKILSW